MELMHNPSLAGQSHTVAPARQWARQRRSGQPRLSWRHTQEVLAHNLLGLLAVGFALVVVIVALTLWQRSRPPLALYPLSDLLTAYTWQPMAGKFGFAPFLAGSASVTLTALVLAVVPAVFSGIYLAEYTSNRLRTLIKPVIDLLVGIPSVVYGLWGVLFVVPLIREHVGPALSQTLGASIPFFRQSNPGGYGLLAGGVVLAIMVFPLIVAVTEEVLRAIPREMRESVLALGATRWETTKCVLFHRALPGVLAAIVLGFSRAFGETLAVMMVVGNVAQIPHSLFDAAYPLPALIANNYGEMMSVPLYESALMAAALLLLMVVLGFNIVARLIIVRLTKV